MPFRCEPCWFECAKLSGLHRHEQSKKHAAALVMRERRCQRCGKQYQSTSGLWKHAKGCLSLLTKEIEIDKEIGIGIDKDKDIDIEKDKEYSVQEELLRQLKVQQEQIALMLQQNQQNQQNQQMKEKEKEKETTHVHHHYQFHQTTNNFMIFLERECGNAVNWSDFVDGLAITLETDLTESLVKTMRAGIERLGVHKRPIHCVDADRCKMYLKTNDAWESDAGKIQLALRESNEILQTRCVRMIQAWDETHPEWHSKESKIEEYRLLAVQITEGVDSERCADTLAKSGALGDKSLK